jgi:site-specific DNA-adenine methylase
MNSNHFIISYFGNKRKEMKDIFEIVDPYLNNKKMIVEPFCGTAAFSYYISLKYPKRFKYVLNDCNENLIKLYHVLKNDEETKKIINEAKELNKDMNKEKYLTLYKNMNESVVSYVG